MASSNVTGDDIVAENASWVFSGDVAKKFDGHVSKSVPFYHEGHDLVSKVSDFFLLDKSVCYEIGCSTGKLTQLLAERHKNKNIDFVGVDREEEMLEQARARCKDLPKVSFLQSELLDVDFAKCDLVVSYYTVQFVPPKNRQTLIDRIFQSLNWGGAFLLFEKVRGPDARFQDLLTAIYTEFKLDNGYTPSEIVAKARSLKGVLEPFSTAGNLELLTRAGFKDVMTIFKYGCFEGFLAIK